MEKCEKSFEKIGKILKWLGPESNQRHKDFQSSALPTELPSLSLIIVNKHHRSMIDGRV